MPLGDSDESDSEEHLLEKQSRAIEAKRKRIQKEAELEAAEMAVEEEVDDEFTWQPPSLEEALQERILLHSYFLSSPISFSIFPSLSKASQALLR